MPDAVLLHNVAAAHHVRLLVRVGLRNANLLLWPHQDSTRQRTSAKELRDQSHNRGLFAFPRFLCPMRTRAGRHTVPD